MRFADLILRRGHLSEQTIIEAVMTGSRPAHLDRCDLCAERAVELGRSLDETRAIGLDAADAAFPAERLAAQHAQILRRLEQLDEPARVISFPRHTSRLEERVTGRRVSASWVAVAAAAGLVIGVVGGQYSARLTAPDSATVAGDGSAGEPARRTDASYLQPDDDATQAMPLDPLGDIALRTVQASVRIGG